MRGAPNGGRFSMNADDLENEERGAVCNIGGRYEQEIPGRLEQMPMFTSLCRGHLAQ